MLASQTLGNSLKQIEHRNPTWQCNNGLIYKSNLYPTQLLPRSLLRPQPQLAFGTFNRTTTTLIVFDNDTFDSQKAKYSIITNVSKMVRQTPFTPIICIVDFHHARYDPLNLCYCATSPSFAHRVSSDNNMSTEVQKSKPGSASLKATTQQPTMIGLYYRSWPLQTVLTPLSKTSPTLH